LLNSTDIPEQNRPAVPVGNRLSFLRTLLPYLVLITALFILSLVMGLRSSTEIITASMEELVQTLKPIIETLGPAGPVALTLFIFFNNAIKAFFAMILGIIVGLPPLFFIGVNGFMIGITVAALQSSVGYGVIIASLLPHGIIEIPILLLAAALGLRIGAESIRFLIGQKSAVKANVRQGLRIYVKWILGCLFVAAIIEILVTPLVILTAGGK
jgi:stage II sporulation protein M